jgi:hypothetical protein
MTGTVSVFWKRSPRPAKKRGWQVHAFCLMSNHFHLVVENPEPNLVAGMKWFLGAYTSRYNRRHKEFGHLLTPARRGRGCCLYDNLIDWPLNDSFLMMAPGRGVASGGPRYGVRAHAPDAGLGRRQAFPGCARVLSLRLRGRRDQAEEAGGLPAN